MEVEAELAGVLAATLDDLITVAVQVTGGPLMDTWDLPLDDRAALTRWGLPSWYFVPAFADVTPSAVPNVASAREARYESPEDRLYTLGMWGGGPIAVGAVAGSGRVLSLLPKPITTNDFPPVLRAVHPERYTSAVSFVNSSVVQFVETSWRWYSCLQVLQQLTCPDCTEPERAFDEYFSRMQDCIADILTAVITVDPAVDSSDDKSLWLEVIGNYPS